MLKIRKNDKVLVLTGRDAGKEGTVESVDIKNAKAVVSGVNVFKKHQKRQNERPGSVIEIIKPVSISKLALVCPKCKKASRVQFKVEGENKSRICARCDEVISTE